MANTRHRQDTQHRDEDKITFAGSPYIVPTDGNPHHRPGLPHQTVDVATAKGVTRQAAAPPDQQPEPSTQQDTRQTNESYEFISFDISEELPRPQTENYWKNPRLLFRLLRRKCNQQSSCSASGSIFDAAWKRVRVRFSRKSSSISQTLGSERQRSSSHTASSGRSQAAETADAPKVDETATTNPVVSETLPVNEVDSLLAQHRSKLSAGHEGQLRRMH
jgi:hypothetical protein